MNESARITVAIPCFNEATTVAKVVADFRAQLPEADILVCDNCSTDGTAEAELAKVLNRWSRPKKTAR